MVRSLRAARMPGPDALSGNVLAALAEAGAFRPRAVLVGSLAFQCYPPMLGFRPSAVLARTGDVDIGQLSAISIAVKDRMEPDLPAVLKTVDSRFEAVPSPFDPHSVLRYALRDGRQERLSVDILTPLRGPPRDRSVHRPALGGEGQPLRFLDFLIYQEIEAVVLHGPGLPVKVPAPERFAVHKLLVASRRRPDAVGRGKARKDLAQADILCRVLGQDRPYDLADAWKEIVSRGPAWAQAAERGKEGLSPEAREFLPSAETPHRSGNGDAGGSGPARRQASGQDGWTPPEPSPFGNLSNPCKGEGTT